MGCWVQEGTSRLLPKHPQQLGSTWSQADAGIRGGSEQLGVAASQGVCTKPDRPERADSGWVLGWSPADASHALLQGQRSGTRRGKNPRQVGACYLLIIPANAFWHLLVPPSPVQTLTPALHPPLVLSSPMLTHTSARPLKLAAP